MTRHAVTAPMVALAAALVTAGCARMQSPPGGRIDRIPPSLVETAPGNGTVNVQGDEVHLTFDKVINDQGDLANKIIISPRDGETKVSWHRHSLRVRPTKGWRPNTAYTIHVLPGIADLWGNTRAGDTTIVFSTGPRIPTGSLHGRVFDMEHGTPIPQAVIEASLDTDSTLVYVTVADSLGAFRLGTLPAGIYRVRGTADANRNLRFDVAEAYDSLTTPIRDSAAVELMTFLHDSAGPRLNTMQAEDSVAVRVTFSLLLDPARMPTVAQFVVLGPDSAAVPIRSLTIPTPDTTAAADSVARVEPKRTEIPAYGRTGRTVTAPGQQVKPTKPLARRDIVLVMTAPLRPKTTYTVRATDIRGVGNTTATSSGTFTTPATPSTSQAP